MYELAAEFGCNRSTVAARLKKAGIVMRLQSPRAEVIESMVSLYESGLSFQEAGTQLGYSVSTVRNYLRAGGVRVRDTQPSISTINDFPREVFLFC